MSELEPTFKLSIAGGKRTAKVKAMKATLEQLEKALTSHRRRNRKDGATFVPAIFFNNYRNTANHRGSFAVVLDYDDMGISAAECIQRITTALPGTHIIVYSTFQYTPEEPRVRAVVILSRLVSADEYRQLADILAEKIGILIDPCSVSPVQAMYLPAAPPGAEIFTHIEPGHPLNVDSFDLCPMPESVEKGKEKTGSKRNADLQTEEENEDVEYAGLTVQERVLLQTILDAYPAQGLDWHQWWELTVIAYHMFQGSKEARDMCQAWSAKSDKHDPQEIPRRWPTYKRKSHEKILGWTRLSQRIAEHGGPHRDCIDSLITQAKGIRHD